MPDRAQPTTASDDEITDGPASDGTLAAERGASGTGPFFVVGAHRSGTTLLRFMLSSHPRLYLPPESEFIPAFFGRHPERPVPRRRAQRLLDRVFTGHRFARDWRSAPPRIDELVAGDGPVTPAAWIDGLYRAYARQHGADRWGDKTPSYASHLELLHRIFPAARFVHLVRDGRDVALSVLDTWGGSRPHLDVGYAALTWRRRVEDVRRAARALPEGAVLEVRYERLVREPEATLRGICRFLGERYEPPMAAPHELARGSIPAGSFHESVRHPPSPARCGRWRVAMSPRDRRLFEALAGRTLAAVGYPVEESDPGTGVLVRAALATARYRAIRAFRRALELTRLRMPN